jgi:hypothetical protein
MKATLFLLMLLCSTALSQERGWFIVEQARLGWLTDSLAFDTGRLDTVWRDTLMQEKNPRYVPPEKPIEPPKEEPIGDIKPGDEKPPVEPVEPEFIYVSHRVQRIVPRMAGGYATAGVKVIDTLHTLYCIMVYTSKERMAKLEADAQTIPFEKPLDDKDTVTTYKWVYSSHLETVTYKDTVQVGKFTGSVKDTVVTKTYDLRVRDSVQVPVYTVTATAKTQSKGTVDTKKAAAITSLLTASAVKEAKPITTWETLRDEAIKMMSMKRADINGTEVSRRDE